MAMLMGSVGHPVVRRCAMLGAAAGTAVCGVLGTIEFPVLGTFIGAVTGAVGGLLVGLLNAIVLLRLAGPTASTARIRTIAATTTVAATAVLAAWADAPRYVLPICAMVIAALLAPAALRGSRPARLGDRVFTPATAANRLATLGAVAGAAIGATAGLVIGARSYLPTMPVAVVEGALLGAASGIVLALLAAALLICATLRPR